jgi:two-component system, NtrC family, sensor kinase
MFNYIALTSIINGITSTALGYFVYTRGRKDIRCLTYVLLCLSVSVWSYFYFLWQTAQTAHLALYWVRGLMAGAIFIPVNYLHYILASVNQHRNKKRLLILGYAAACTFFLFNFTPYFVKGVAPSFLFRFWPVPGPLFHIYIIMFILYAVYGLFVLWTSYRHSTGATQNQLLYVFLATIIGYTGGFTNFPLWYNIPFYPAGNILVSVSVAIFAYAIVKHRLMDITVVIHKGLAYGLLLGLIFVPTYVAILITQRATFYSVPPFLAGTLIFACGLWIVFSNPRASPNVTFGLVCLAVCVWLFGVFMMFSAHSGRETYFWSKFNHIGIVYIPAFFYHFCASFLPRKQKKRLLLPNYLFSTAFLVLIPTDYLLNGQYSYFWGYYPKAGSLYSLFLTYFAAVIGFSLIRLYRGYHDEQINNTQEVARVRYVFWAFIIAFMASIDFIPMYGYEFYPAGYIFVSLWVMIVTYAIAKHQLLDITLSINKNRLLTYGQVLAVIPFYFVILLLIWSFTGSMHYLLAGILVATFSILSGVVRNLHIRMENAIGKALFRKRYDAYDTLKEFSKAMVSILDLKDLNKEIIVTLSKVMGIGKISLYLLDQEKGTYFLAATNGMDEEALRQVNISKDDRFPQYFMKTGQLTIKEELEHRMTNASDTDRKEVVSTLSLIGSELCIPLMNKEQLIGFLNLGHKDNQEMYTPEDLNLLSTLAQNAAIALDNALLYEDLKRQKTLMRRTDRLRSLETIAGGFAHEIRNPLTSIKTFIQLAPERREDEEFVGSFSKVVSEDVHRIERLIQEILDYARYMQPRLIEEDLNDVVESSLYFVRVKADGKAISVEKELAADLPTVLIDRQQIKQVLLNLYLNALDAMPDGGRLFVKTHSLSKGNENRWVQIEVRDTGSGISGENLDHIFDPFFTTKHESEEREGTGLGLTIIHQIVQEHRGYIEVQSEPGVGTTFFVNLPANPMMHERRKEREVVT